ncbi:peptidase M4, partial [Streptomyces sp. SID4982]|nr:peptidase M4 [Streptomyces sp. SID4982]
MSSSPSSNPSRRPVSPRRRTATVALAGVAALIAAAVQSGAATAAPAQPAQGKADPAHSSVRLTPAQRAGLIRDAEAGRADTARS